MAQPLNEPLLVDPSSSTVLRSGCVLRHLAAPAPAPAASLGRDAHGSSASHLVGTVPLVPTSQVMDSRPVSMQTTVPPRDAVHAPLDVDSAATTPAPTASSVDAVRNPSTAASSDIATFTQAIAALSKRLEDVTIVQLERENPSLRNAFEQLRAEIAEMKRAGKTQPAQQHLTPVTETAETPMEIPSKTPATGRPAKKSALSKLLRDEGFDELRAELREFQSDLRDALIALSEAVSALNVRVDSVESKFKITAKLSGSSVDNAIPSTGSSTVQAAQKAAQPAPAPSI
ncbi:hypothetical protein HPB49_006008 [Dermacentor silvarum]|uniref:Uncharacterized protein n=1 Tax=Dermacentor silvarum TaxID=543639 RepID=A0ACB8DBC3_DERSI|nr:hypothetical protein HPB49_006008 [Dermacentor silvarum]